jgi:hypothetical protein
MMPDPIVLHEMRGWQQEPRYTRPLLVEGHWPHTPNRLTSISLPACRCGKRSGQPGSVCGCGDAIPGPGEPGYVENPCLECGEESVYRYRSAVDPTLTILLCRVHAPSHGGGEWIQRPTPRASFDDRQASSACMEGRHEDCLGYGFSPSRVQVAACPCGCGHRGERARTERERYPGGGMATPEAP